MSLFPLPVSYEKEKKKKPLDSGSLWLALPSLPVSVALCPAQGHVDIATFDARDQPTVAAVDLIPSNSFRWGGLISSKSTVLCNLGFKWKIVICTSEERRISIDSP